jgi:hypothetical protein
VGEDYFSKYGLPRVEIISDVDEPHKETKSRTTNIDPEPVRTIEVVAAPQKERKKAHGFFGWRNYIICPNPNCGYEGKPIKKARGSTGCLLFLILIGGALALTFFLLPVGLVFLFIALIYGLLKGGYNYLCPQCGMQVRSDH